MKMQQCQQSATSFFYVHQNCSIALIHLKVLNLNLKDSTIIRVLQNLLHTYTWGVEGEIHCGPIDPGILDTSKCSYEFQHLSYPASCLLTGRLFS